MNQIKIGKFIQSLRNEKSLTQRELAEKLNISDKTVSKWETGNGLPEVGLMLPLCELLEISVNELLSGERLGEKQYYEKAEKNIMELMKEKAEAKKKIILSVVVALATLIAGGTLVVLSGALEMPLWLRIMLIVMALFVIASGIGVCCVLDRDVGIYECTKCKTEFVPTMRAYIMAPHTITTRWLKCPNCKRRSFCKKHLTKKQNDTEK